MTAPGSLYVVATPLGNLEDVTLRALRVLKEVNWIAAEDTRVTRKFLHHYGIGTPLTRYDDWTEREKAPRLIQRLLAGESGALVSDAGTPGLSDPGFHLVRSAWAAGVKVVPVPGPSAVIAALSAAGLPANRFVFEGFLPPRAVERRARLAELADEHRTVVFFETARRLRATLEDMVPIWNDRTIVIARELTKKFEEFLRGSARALLSQLAARPQPLRGELTVIAEGTSARAQRRSAASSEWQQTLAQLCAQGMSLRDAARRVAQQYGLSRREVYQFGLRRS
ncbi:MAG: ribosomal RNA small subunit methyltransferase I [Candidatus Binatia bacterium]|nr:MAG: ribosomal RNA small subunit methyltransferase I [Candidatus Binatia bacterium]